MEVEAGIPLYSMKAKISEEELNHILKKDQKYSKNKHMIKFLVQISAACQGQMVLRKRLMLLTHLLREQSLYP